MKLRLEGKAHTVFGIIEHLARAEQIGKRRDDMITTVEVATMKVQQAARLLGISKATAYLLASQGKLPGARRLGRRIVVSRKALDEFLALAGDADKQGFPKVVA